MLELFFSNLTVGLVTGVGVVTGAIALIDLSRGAFARDDDLDALTVDRGEIVEVER
ncbi:membrane protein [Gordonia phage Gudmit]|nr:membrane protein [Gordonia phage Gudmit]